MRARRPAAVAAAATTAAAACVAAWELAAVARVRRRADVGGRGDHAATVGEGGGAPLRLVLLGDSAVDGHGLTVEQSLPRRVATRLASTAGRRVDVVSLAVSGARSSDVARSQLPLVRAGGRPDAVVVGVGVNDVLRRTPPAELQAATRDVAAGLLSLPEDPALVVLVTHDLSRAPGLGPLLRRVVGWRCRAAARIQREALAGTGIEVVGPAGPGDPSLYGDDGLHPGAAGIAVLAEVVVARLVAAGTAA